jgi:hypothetical protein
MRSPCCLCVSLDVDRATARLTRCRWNENIENGRRSFGLGVLLCGRRRIGYSVFSARKVLSRTAFLNISRTIILSLFLLPQFWSIRHSYNTLFHFSFLILGQSVGLLWWGISPSFDGGSARRKTCTYTNRINTKTSVHALSGIRTPDPSEEQ